MAGAKSAKPLSATVRRQIASKEAWNSGRSAKKAKFFTAGYSRRTREQLITALLEHGVRTLVDIRRDPVSRHRPEMSKSTLADALSANGIFYHHAPELGVPRDVRKKAVESDRRDSIWTWYDKNVVAKIDDLKRFLRQFKGPAVFLCMELDPRECHRHRLALALEKKGLKSFDV